MQNNSDVYLLFFTRHARFPSSHANFSSVFCHLDRLEAVPNRWKILVKMNEVRNWQLDTVNNKQ
jgi:hypothetical protein